MRTLQLRNGFWARKALIMKEGCFGMRSLLYEHTMPGTDRSVLIDRIDSGPREMSREVGKLAVIYIAIALLTEHGLTSSGPTSSSSTGVRGALPSCPSPASH